MKYIDNFEKGFCIDFTEEIRHKVEHFFDRNIVSIIENQITNNVYKWNITFTDNCLDKVYIRFSKDRIRMEHYERGLKFLNDGQYINAPLIIYRSTSCNFLICSACSGKKLSTDTTILNNNLIEMIVSLHTITKRVKLSMSSTELAILKYISEYQSIELWQAINDAMNRNIVQNRQYHFSHKILKKTEQLLNSLQEKMSRYVSEFTFSLDLPFVHGDLHCSNILVEENIYSIIDPEYWHISPFVQNDLVKLLSWPSNKISLSIKLDFITQYYECYSTKSKLGCTLDSFINIFWLIDSYNRMSYFIANEKKEEEDFSIMLDDINTLID